MNVLYFGTYVRAYPRNAQVISCLEAAGVNVIERHRQLWGRRANWSLGLRQLARVAAAEGGLAREHEPEADVVLVGYPGHFDMPAAKRVARGRPIVFNPLVSLHDTLVADRGRFRRGSPAAGLLRSVDRSAFRRADLVVADTAEHAAFFQTAFRLPPERLAVCFVGAEDRLFRPGWHPEHPFHALFIGKLIPLHGVDAILDAARLVPEIPFRIVGSGQLDEALARRPANVTWEPWVEYEELPDEYRAAGCALGIFGEGAKAGRVIPNKAYQALACGRALITGDTPAARELLRDGVDALLVPPGDPRALAHAVRRLAGDAALTARIAEAGRETYVARAGEAALGRRWRRLLEDLIARS
jgi:glycosyltransferase involved in cell wall biosynthesis